MTITMITFGKKLVSALDLMSDEEEEVRMVLPLLLQSLTGRELDPYLSSVELARTAVPKVKMLDPLASQKVSSSWLWKAQLR
jgi:hypothetical protein